MKIKKIALISAIALAGIAGKRKNISISSADLPHKDTIEFTSSVTNPTTNITFTVDTLDKPTTTIAFCSDTSIVRNFIENNDLYSLRLSIMVHENKHRDNVLNGLRNLNLSPLQFTKMCMHDEISASICELLTLRYEYLLAEDKAAFLKNAKKGKFSYYFNSVDEGKIFPEKQDSQSREQEWAFIAQETKNWWIKTYAPIYLPSIIRMGERHLQKIDGNTLDEINTMDYQKVFAIAYNIGGINFWKYIDNDISISDEQIMLMEKVAHTYHLNNNKKEYYSRINAQIQKLKQTKDTISPELLSHIFIAEGLKMSFNDIDIDVIRKNKDVINASYHVIKNQLALSSENIDFSKRFPQLKAHFALSSMNKISDEMMSKLYSYKNTDLSQYIHDIPIFFDYSYSSTYSDFLQCKLNYMRSISTQEPQKKSSKNYTKPKKSAPQTLVIPDFSQPILTNATPEQTEEIFQCIRDFNNIPDVLKQCNLAKQALYYKQHSR